LKKLTDFGWQGFLGKLTPKTVALLGRTWSIPAWTKVPSGKDKQNMQDLKQWISAMDVFTKLDLESTFAELVSQADQIRTVGCPQGRFELQFIDPEWVTQHVDVADQELAALAFIERPKEFKEACDWLEVTLIDKWEFYKADRNDDVLVGKDEIRVLEEGISDYWKDRGLGERCVITTLTRDTVTVIDIGYEQEPEAIQEFIKEGKSGETKLRVIRQVRDALLRYDKLTGDLQVRMYRGNPDKCDDLVRHVAGVCFQNADLFPTGSDRKARYDLSAFSTRHAFLKEIDSSSGLEKIIVIKIVLEPAALRGSRVEAWIPARKAHDAGEDAYDVLLKMGVTGSLKVMRVEMRAHFKSGKRKVLPIELVEKGGASLSGDSRYEIIDDHLHRWEVLK